MRKLVNSYSNIKCFEEDKDTDEDLETLNMHRTAKNCISILKAFSKIGSEYSPVS